MSRSYKKTPIGKDNMGGRKFAKKQANRKVRRSNSVPNGKQYRKFYETWDIYDYVSRCTLNEFMQSSRLWNLYETEEAMIQAWKGWYYHK